MGRENKVNGQLKSKRKKKIMDRLKKREKWTRNKLQKTNLNDL